MKRERSPQRRGQALIEFSLVALVLYLIIGAAITFGIWIFAAGQIQQAANVGARELSQTPLAWDATFEDALQNDVVRSRVYDDRWLVIDLDRLEEEIPDYNFFTDVVPMMPLLNQQLASLYIRQELPERQDPTIDPIDDEPRQRRILRYPGAMLQRGSSDTSNIIYPEFVQTQYVVQIPIVVERDQTINGAERIRWVDVVEEIDTEEIGDENSGESPDPFSLANEGEAEDDDPPRGVVALRIHYPAQSTWMSSFQDRGSFVPNVANPNAANDQGVQPINPDAQRGTLLPRDLIVTNESGERIFTGTYGGQFGLGVHGALTSPTLTGDAVGIRPYRRVLVSQAIFRREAFEEPEQ